MIWNDVIKLIDAGFTRDDIMAMMDTSEKQTPTPAPAPAPTPEPEPTPDEPPAPEPAPTPQPAEDEVTKLLRALGSQMEGLRKTIQTHNVNSIEGTPDPGMDTDAILASIINPHYKEG